MGAGGLAGWSLLHRTERPDSVLSPSAPRLPLWRMPLGCCLGESSPCETQSPEAAVETSEMGWLPPPSRFGDSSTRGRLSFFLEEAGDASRMGDMSSFLAAPPMSSARGSEDRLLLCLTIGRSGRLIEGESKSSCEFLHPGEGDGDALEPAPGEGEARLREAALTALPATCAASFCSAAVAPRATRRGFGASCSAAVSSGRTEESTSPRLCMMVSGENCCTVVMTATSAGRRASTFSMFSASRSMRSNCWPRALSSSDTTSRWAHSRSP
mmetsp:Transcript_26357/g.78537  ORF Transcript_26357/g.78537 Transcript_26357/m.78537 type:complete len:269 (+) Transcript_26357:346-1152(+)